MQTAQIKKEAKAELSEFSGDAQAELKRLVAEATANFEDFKLGEAVALLQQARDILKANQNPEHDLQINVDKFKEDASTQMKEAKKNRTKDEAYWKLAASKTLTIEQLITLMDYFGAEREQSDYLDRLLSMKRIVHIGRDKKKKGYKILRFRAVDGHGFIKIEGFEHVQFLEQEINKGWVPVDHQSIHRILNEETARAVHKLEERLPETPDEIIELIELLRDRKTQPELIKKKILETKPTVKVGEHGAQLDFYLEKGNRPLIHLSGYPSKALIPVEKEPIEKAVPFAHLYKELDEKLKRIAPFKIGEKQGLADVIKAAEKDIKKIPEFSKEFSQEEVEALLFLRSKHVIIA